MGNYISISLPVLFLAAVFQSGFMPQVRLLGGSPDLVLLVVLCWAINTELEEGIAWAFVGGILQDLLSAAPTGAATLGLLPTLFIIYMLNRQLYKIGFLLVLALLFIGTLIKEIIMAVVMAFAGFGSNVPILFSYVILPTAAYNVIVGVVVYAIVRWVQRRSSRDFKPYR